MNLPLGKKGQLLGFELRLRDVFVVVVVVAVAVPVAVVVFVVFFFFEGTGDGIEFLTVGEHGGKTLNPDPIVAVSFPKRGCWPDCSCFNEFTNGSCTSGYNNQIIC